MKYLLQRYLAAQFIKPLIIGTAFFVIFLLTFQLFRVTGLIVSKGLDYGFVIELVWQIALSLIPLALPLSIYFSTVFSLGKASEESELVIMRSAGMSKFQLLMPYLIVSIMAAVLLFFINNVLAPRAKISFKEKVQFLKTQGTLTDIKPGEFFTLIPRVALFTQEFNSKTNELEDVFIHFSEENGSEKTVIAKSGKIIKSVSKAGDVEMKLILSDGNILQVKGEDNEKIVFSEYIFPIPLGGGISFNPKPQNMEGKDLDRFLNGGLDAFLRPGRGPKEFHRVQIEYHNRRNMPIVLVILTLLGFSLGFKNNRGRNKNGIKVFVYLIGYYVLYFSAISQGSSGKFYIPLLVYGPSALLFLIFVYHYRKMDWLS